MSIEIKRQAQDTRVTFKVCRDRFSGCLEVTRSVAA
jgi:hypothetical protein